MNDVVTLYGTVHGHQIELDTDSGLPSGCAVELTLRLRPLSASAKEQLVDQLCGAWVDDPSLAAVFALIERERKASAPREVDFDAPS